MIIERTICCVLSPSTAFYRSFLKQICTLTKTCPNLPRGDKALILVPSDCYWGILQSLNLRSFSDWRKPKIYKITRLQMVHNFIKTETLQRNYINYIKCSIILFDSDNFDLPWSHIHSTNMNNKRVCGQKKYSIISIATKHPITTVYLCLQETLRRHLDRGTWTLFTSWKPYIQSDRFVCIRSVGQPQIGPHFLRNIGK